MRPGQAAEAVLYRDTSVEIKAATRDTDADLHVCAYLLTTPPP